MASWTQELEAAREELHPEWDAERSTRLHAGMGARRRRRVVARASMVALAVSTTAMVLTLGNEPGTPSELVANAEAGALSSASLGALDAPAGELASGEVARAHTVRFVDGSSAHLFGEQSELEVVRNERARVGLRLLSGRAHFEVVPSQTRTFEIEVAPYRVAVLGTVFDVERGGEHVEVSVTRGRVRVYGPHGADDLAPGQAKRFPIAPASATSPDPQTETIAPREPVEPFTRAQRAPQRSAQESAPSWRTLTQSGDYDAAFASLRRERAVDNDPAVLMDAADAARLSGHPSVAVGYLERVVRGHASSPVAPLAAFTLGRVYLDQLGRPHEAALAFAGVRKLSPKGSLAEDALAREVEALSKAGDATKAYSRAQEYLRRYPAGPRLRAVRLYGGLD